MHMNIAFAPAGESGGGKPAMTAEACLTRALICLRNAANDVAEAADFAGRAGHPERKKRLGELSRDIAAEMPGIEAARSNAAGQ